MSILDGFPSPHHQNPRDPHSNGAWGHAFLMSGHGKSVSTYTLGHAAPPPYGLLQRSHLSSCREQACPVHRKQHHHLLNQYLKRIVDKEMSSGVHELVARASPKPGTLNAAPEIRFHQKRSCDRAVGPGLSPGPSASAVGAPDVRDVLRDMTDT